MRLRSQAVRRPLAVKQPEAAPDREPRATQRAPREWPLQGLLTKRSLRQAAAQPSPADQRNAPLLPQAQRPGCSQARRPVDEAWGPASEFWAPLPPARP